jgi:hypothetical protein
MQSNLMAMVSETHIDDLRRMAERESRASGRAPLSSIRRYLRAIRR